MARVFKAALIVFALVLGAAPASAQTDKWQVDVAPLYLWAAETSGHISAGSKSVPVFMDFGDAAKHLAGAFALHVEARKARWGAFGDINFIRLTTDTTFSTPILARPVTGSIKFDNTIFEAGTSYLVKPDVNFAVIGGVRSYNLSPKLTFETDVVQLTPVDVSKTAVTVFGGFTCRPKLAPKWTLLTRGDIGGGEGYSWSGTLGFEFRLKPWAGLMFGYHALGTHVGTSVKATTLPTNGEGVETAYNVTQYGPVFSLTLHWNQK
jgi:hypothetical protein